MRYLDRKDLPPYTDVYTKYCPHCGVRFYADRRLDVFHTDKCYKQYYSLLQRNDTARLLADFNLPVQREWVLRTREKLHIYLLTAIHTTDQLEEIQDFPVISKFMNVNGIERRRVKKQKAVSQLELFDPSTDYLYALILADIKEIVDYPPAFENEQRVHLILDYLIFGD